MSTIIRALEIAKEVGTCWYRPHNGDIIVNPTDEPQVIIDKTISEWTDNDVKEFYFAHSEDWVQEAWMKININKELTLSVCYE